MRNILQILFVLGMVLVALFFFLSAAAHGQVPYSWVTAIGNLDVLLNQSIFESTYAQLRPWADDMAARISATWAMRTDADNRVMAAIKELCERDPPFCADVFERYRLRWHE